VIGAAAEASALLIGEPEGEIVGLFELQCKVLFRPRSSSARERAMRMTSSAFSRRLCPFSVFIARIWYATAIRERSPRGWSGAECAHRGKTVMTIRRPVDPFSCTHRDDRVEEPPHAANDAAQPLDMGFRQVALKRRGLHRVDGQACKEVPVPARGVAVASYHPASAVMDGLHKGLDLRGR